MTEADEAIPSKAFATTQAFLAGALLNSIPGIIVQLILIPTIMAALNRTGLVKFRREKPATSNAL